MPSNLRDVASDRLPALDLARIFGRHAAAHVVPAIPLEPAAWIVGVNPALVPPDRQGLASIDAETIKRWVGTGRREFRARKPARGSSSSTAAAMDYVQQRVGAARKRTLTGRAKPSSRWRSACARRAFMFAAEDRR
jgi:hypothetical protein